MMSLLSSPEALQVSHAFLLTLYGPALYERWVQLKHRMTFSSEKEFVNWILDCLDGEVVEDDELLETKLSPTSNTKKSSEPPDEKSYGSDSLLQKFLDERDKMLDASLGLGIIDDMDDQKDNVDDVLFISDDDTCDKNGFTGDENVVTMCNGTTLDDEDDGLGDALEAADLVKPAKSREKLKRYNCPICHYVTDSKSAFDSHQRTHTGERPFLCPEATCNKQFRSRSNLTSHIKVVHRQIKLLTCPHCQYKAGKKSNLRDHLVNRHGYRGQYRCDTCGKYQTSQAAHNLHMRTHLRL